MGWDNAEPARDDRRVHHRVVGARVPRERHLLVAPRCSAPARPVGRPHARVDDLVAAARVQLRRGAGCDAPRRVLAPQVHRGRRRSPRCACPVPIDAVEDHVGRRPAQHPHAVAVVLAARVRVRPPILGYGFVFKNWWILAAGVGRHAVRHYRLGARTADRSGPPFGHGEHVVSPDRRGALMTPAVVPAGRVGRGPRRPQHRHEHRRQQRQARDLAVPLVGGVVLRRVHRDVLPLPRSRCRVPDKGVTDRSRPTGCSTSRSRR